MASYLRPEISSDPSKKESKKLFLATYTMKAYRGSIYLNQIQKEK